jgi:hypothetical protein
MDRRHQASFSLCTKSERLAMKLFLEYLKAVEEAAARALTATFTTTCVPRVFVAVDVTGALIRRAFIIVAPLPPIVVGNSDISPEHDPCIEA